MYDITKLPPNRHQIETERRKAEVLAAQLPFYNLMYWSLLLTVLAVNLSLGFYIQDTTWKFVVVGTTTCVCMVGVVFSNSIFDDRKFRCAYELQMHEYLENHAPLTAVFEGWCENSAQVGRYVAAVSDQGRNLTYGEYLAVKNHIKQRDRNTRISIRSVSVQQPH